VGDLEIVPLTSKIYGNERKLSIWLPPGYRDAAHQQTTYSVLYMFDGTWLFDKCTAPGSQGEWKIDETLTELIGKREVEPIIVVGIDSNQHRDEEYAPYGNPLFFGPPKMFKGASVPEFLTEDVLPYVAAHYRLKKGREHTGVGGSSLGGVAALNALIKRPDVFGIGLLESASMQFGNGQLLRDVTPVVMGPVRISIGVGTRELGPDATMLGVPDFDNAFVTMNKTLAENFKASMANHPKVLFTVQEGAHHGAAAWGVRFPAAVKFLYPSITP
jgi:enterochelin esterase-like enzyme